VSDATNSDEVVTLVRVGELTTAQLLCGRLDAEGIECFIPDEYMATQTWHLHAAIGGIRVQVRRSDLERAQEILAQPGLEIAAAEGVAPGAAGAGQPNGEEDKDDGSISAGDRAAFRALRVALVSLWLMGLVHPYSLWLAVRALRRDDVTAWGRRRAGIALVISVAGCAWMVILARWFVRLAG
jgi:hypothetical protein